jgi:Protein of unknown function (DUF3224)
MSSPHRIARRVMTGVVTVALTATTVTFASVQAASGDDESVKVNFTESDPVTGANFGNAYIADLSRCSFDPVTFALLGPCVDPTTQAAGFDATYRGDITGTSKSEQGAVLAALNEFSATAVDVPFVKMDRVDATIAHCGTGSFILRRDGNLNSPNTTWTIVAGSGRGDLVGLRGNGTALDITPPGGTALARLTGRVRCHRHDS